MYPMVKELLHIYTIILLIVLALRSFLNCEKGNTIIPAALVPTVIYLLNI